MSDLINANALRLASLRRKNLLDLATLKELVWLAHNDDVALANAINSLNAASYLKKVSYTVGTADTDADYKFTSAANMTEQSIQLGATTIIPGSSPISSIVPKAIVGLVGGNVACDIGSTSGGDQYISSVDLTALNAITSAGPFVAVSAAGSIYFSATPDANWDTLSAWKVKVDIYYTDGSL